MDPPARSTGPTPVATSPGRLPRHPGRQGRGSRWRRRYVPPQHGAWAMLLVPFLAGVMAAGASWVQVPLLVAWLSGYLLSYYLFLALKTRTLARVRSQVLLYTATAVPSGLLVLALRPELLVYAPLFAVLLTVNAWYAWRRADRSLLNDLSSVVQACLMVPLAAGAAGVELSVVVRPSVAVLLYFVGTVLYVKTMIRERGDPTYLRASVAFHAVAVGPAAWVGWPLGVLFAWLLLRSAWWPRRRLTPRQVGLVEVAHSAALVVLLVWVR